MAFITKPAPFTIAIDGCYRKEQLNTLCAFTPCHHITMTATWRAEINYLEEFEQCATV